MIPVSYTICERLSLTLQRITLSPGSYSALLFLGSDGSVKIRPSSSNRSKASQGELSAYHGDVIGIKVGTEALDVLPKMDGFGFRELLIRGRVSRSVCVARQVYRSDENLQADRRAVPRPRGATHIQPLPRPTKLPEAPRTDWYVGPFPLDDTQPLRVGPSARTKPKPVIEGAADPFRRRTLTAPSNQKKGKSKSAKAAKVSPDPEPAEKEPTPPPRAFVIITDTPTPRLHAPEPPSPLNSRKHFPGDGLSKKRRRQKTATQPVDAISTPVANGVTEPDAPSEDTPADAGETRMLGQGSARTSAGGSRGDTPASVRSKESRSPKLLSPVQAAHEAPVKMETDGTIAGEEGT